MHIVLLEPEIPQNAGNIARTCAVTNSVLHLIKPLGFSVEDKYLKRAGLDYWKLLDIRYYENFQDFCEKNPDAKIWMASTKARHVYSDVTYGEDDYVMFGRESAGIPEEILMAHEANTIRIPMLEAARSLNLSNSVAIVLYEALRQNGFEQMQRSGWLRRKPSMFIRMSALARMILSCLVRKVPESRRRFWWTMKKPVSGFLCCRRSVL